MDWSEEFDSLMSETNVHTLANFENALRDMRNEVLRMSSIAEQNLKNAVNGLLTRNGELCNEAIADDDDVNTLERSIDALCFEILVRYNPVATDLREVLAGMKVANNLERISDEAESIARRSRKILKHPEILETRMIEPLYRQALGLYHDATRTYTDGNTELGLTLYEKDKALDKAHNQVIKELTKCIDDDNTNAKPFLHLILIVRSLERVGDHCVNIGEDAIFRESAADVRHLGPERAAEEIEQS